jgi:hypothetical protein
VIEVIKEQKCGKSPGVKYSYTSKAGEKFVAEDILELVTLVWGTEELKSDGK